MFLSNLKGQYPIDFLQYQESNHDYKMQEEIKKYNLNEKRTEKKSILIHDINDNVIDNNIIAI